MSNKEKYRDLRYVILILPQEIDAIVLFRLQRGVIKAIIHPKSLPMLEHLKLFIGHRISSLMKHYNFWHLTARKDDVLILENTYYSFERSLQELWIIKERLSKNPIIFFEPYVRYANDYYGVKAFYTYKNKIYYLPLRLTPTLENIPRRYNILKMPYAGIRCFVYRRNDSVDNITKKLSAFLFGDENKLKWEWIT